MLGHKARDFRPLTEVSLEDLVPEDNFYRRLEECLDLDFIPDFVSTFYSEIGRPYKRQPFSHRSRPRSGSRIGWHAASRWAMVAWL